jgi:4-hydroxy-3-methylbut-2-enyl diphosphate reductase
LIHNPQAVESLSARGLQVADSIDKITGTVVFRSHGVPIETQKQAEAHGLQIIDATCPLVKVPQNFARKLEQGGYFVFIVGDASHPEVIGVRSYVSDEGGMVVKSAADVDAWLAGREPSEKPAKVGVICQTTLKKSLFDEVVGRCRELFSEVKVHNTICSATRDRQEAATELASEVECMIVIGGRNSSNTQKLFEICQSLSKYAFLVEDETELRADWFAGVNSVGITAGASTPIELLDTVSKKIEEFSLDARSRIS